jgi:hypothetical protein
VPPRPRPSSRDSRVAKRLAANAEDRLTDADLAAIRCPMLVTDPENEQFWPGQPARLAEGLTGPVTLLPSTAADGADGHREPMAAGLRGEQIFDWLGDTIRDSAGISRSGLLVTTPRPRPRAGPAGRLRRRGNLPHLDAVTVLTVRNPCVHWPVRVGFAQAVA